MNTRLSLTLSLTLLTLSSAPATAEGTAATTWTPLSIQLEAELDPAAGSLQAKAHLDFRAGSEALRLALHPALTLDSVVELGTSRQLEVLQVEAGNLEEAPLQPAVYELVELTELRGGVLLEVRYHGTLRQDITAGEQPGQIHNFQMQAHIGTEGVYLEADAYWHPRLPPAADNTPAPLVTHELVVEAPSDLVLVASGERSETNSTHWTTPLPLPGLTLVGGQHRVWQRQVGDVLVRAHLSEDSAAFAEPLLQATEHYLGLFQPRLGAYPYREFTIVENFFSSGFAFPGFTLLAKEVIRMGESSLRPGYLDHELLHSWWGNGVYVSPEDGNWCEALATFCGNYMRPVLEGHDADGRKFRRDVTESVSRLDDDRLHPLGDFQLEGAPEEVSRFQGYQGGAMVFHELQRQLGQEAMWNGLRRFYTEHKGQHAGWAELQAAFEAESGRDLDAFFHYWLRGDQVPEIAVTAARTVETGIELEVHADFGSSDSEMTSLGSTLPLKLKAADGITIAERDIAVQQGTHTVRWNLPAEVTTQPLTVEVDPDFLTLRRLPPQLLMPTLSAVGLPQGLTLVQSSEESEAAKAAYAPVVEAFERRYTRSPDDLRQVDAANLQKSLGEGDYLILGRATQQPAVQAVLENSPVKVTAGGFQLDGTSYTGPADALLACLRNPNDPEGVVCLYSGNRPEALERAHLLPFYGGNSLIVFQSGSPVERRDFEGVERVATLRSCRSYDPASLDSPDQN